MIQPLKKRTIKEIFDNEDSLDSTWDKQLSDYLKKYDKKKGYIFDGIYMKDKVNFIKVKPKQFFIVNYDTSEKNGSHWVGILKNGNKVYHFGSYGIPPLVTIQGKFSQFQIQYNDRAVQKSGTKICGHLCVSFIEHMLVKNDFNGFINECTRYSNRYKIDMEKNVM